VEKRDCEVVMLTITDENKRLFGELVSDHISKLNDLMGHSMSTALDEALIHKVNLATKLLEGSTRMLGLSSWSNTLSMLRELLNRGLTSREQWDEKLSQVVSEILEAEEQMLAEILTGELEELSIEAQFEGLQREMEYLLSEDFSEANLNESDVLPDIGVAEMDRMEEHSTEVDEAKEGFRSVTIASIVGSMSVIEREISECIARGRFEVERCKNLENAFGDAEFAFDMLHNVARKLSGPSLGFKARVSTGKMVEFIKDFFSIYRKARGLDAEIEVRCEGFLMDLKYAKALASVSEGMIFDICRIFTKRSGSELTISIVVKNEGNVCTVEVHDNGAEYLNDSKFDRPDPVSYYQSLREIRNTLEMYEGLLWIEPSGGESGRFRFSVPSTDEIIEFGIVNVDGYRFAIRKSVIDTVLSSGDIAGETLQDRTVDLEGLAVPVFSISEILDSGEANGDLKEGKIVVIGLADRRVGLIIDGDVEYRSAKPIQISSNDHGAIVKKVLNLEEEEIPILDTVAVMNRSEYLRCYEMSFSEVEGFAE